MNEPLSGAAFVSTGGVASWNNSANWNPEGVPNGPAASADFDTPTSSRTVTLDAAIAARAITFEQNGTFTNALTNGTGGPLTLGAPSSGATITASGTGTGLTTVSASMQLPETITVNVTNTVGLGSAAGAALSLTGAMNGAGGLTKTGDGALTIAAIPNTTDVTKLYTGPTNVNAGRLRFSPIGAPVQSSSVSVAAGGQLFLIPSSAQSDFGFGTGTLTLNGRGLPNDGPFDATKDGALRFDTTTTNSVTSSNPVVLATDSSMFIKQNNTFTFNNAVSGGGLLIKEGDGTLALHGRNSYGGGTIVDEGTLIIGGANGSLGSGNVIVGNVALSLTIETGTLNAIADTATLTLGGGGVRDLADHGYIQLTLGVNEVVGMLVLGNVIQGIGTYGSSASDALFKSDEYFSGPGILTVTLPEPSAATGLLAAFALARRRRRHRSLRM